MLRRNPFVHAEIGEFSGEAGGSRATAPNGRAPRKPYAVAPHLWASKFLAETAQTNSSIIIDLWA
jgi:hypothetical protein